MGQTFVTFLLDETGSMASIWDDTIGGFNAYIHTLKSQAQTTGEDIRFTLIKFDSNLTTVVHRAVPISAVPPLTRETYVPGAATPLIDACVAAIHATAERAPVGAKVLMVIQTDGIENASTTFKNADLHRLIKGKQAIGWTFIFVGAGIDAFAQASAMGIQSQHTMSYGRTRTAQAFDALARNTVLYAAAADVKTAGAVASFTAEQRVDSADPDQLAQTPRREAIKSLVDDIKI